MINGVLPDPRRHVYRADLAAASLRDHVEAPRYVEGKPRRVAHAVLPLRSQPRFDAKLDSEALFGETVTLYDESEGWAWVQLDRDAHVGYMPSEGLARELLEPTHRVAALRSYVFPEPDVKAPPLALLSMNSLLTVRPGASVLDGKFLELASGGFAVTAHMRPVAETAPDFAAVAEAFTGAPYLWGGRTSLGLDCSGLVQLAAEAVGLHSPRDADMQAAELGVPVDWQAGAPLARGDLVFWDGHVGIMTGADRFLHANAYHMAVVAEPLSEARTRIAKSGSEIIGVRRLPRVETGPARKLDRPLMQDAKDPKQDDDRYRNTD